MSTSPSTPARPSPAKVRARPPRAPIVAPGTQQFEAIRALRARHIGPIAKVFAVKAASEARTPEEFCERLADKPWNAAKISGRCLRSRAAIPRNAGSRP